MLHTVLFSGMAVFKRKFCCKSRAMCTLCNENVLRSGDNSANFTITNLWQHLECAHKSEYDGLKVQQALEEKEKVQPVRCTGHQSNVAAAFSRGRN